jgi:hypothetical protein
MRPTHALAALVLATAVPLAAQEGQPAKADADKAVQGSGTLPEGWMARVDKDAPLTKVKFENMAPGWHVTLGPAAVFYRATDNVAGNAHIVATFHLFPGASHPEGFGLVIGGQDLQGPNQAYTYFLVRSDGTYLIKRRKGAELTTVVDWTANEAVKAAGPDGKSTNELSVQIGKDKVSFMVNGKEVHSAPASSVDSQGIVGLRVNHNLSVHVQDFAVHKM